MGQASYNIFLPYVARNATVGEEESLNEGNVYSLDTTWWEWAQDVEAFFDPVLERVADTRTDIDELNAGACGTPFETFVPPIDPTEPLEFYMLAGTPTVQQIAYVIGISLGRPMAYLRAIQNSGNLFGMNFFVMLIYFMAAGMAWIIFVTIVTYSARLIRGAIDLIIQIYDLIPFKAT